MIRPTLAQVIDATGASLVQLSAGSTAESIELAGVGTDTRLLEGGELFIALSGPNFNGNRFAQRAIECGAGALLLAADTDVSSFTGSTPILLHDDPLRAMCDLASWHRSQLTCPVIAITGSSGKTSTKNIAEQLFGRLRRVVASPKSFNNIIGVPLTLFKADATTELVICELGTNAPGEIAALCRIARPFSGVVTNVGPAHLERLESVEGVAAEKAELPASLPADGFLVVNADDAFAGLMRSTTSARVIDFSVEGVDADLVARDVLEHDGGVSFRLDELEVASPLFGRHNVANLLAVFATAKGLGFDGRELLPHVADLTAPSQRMERHDLAGLTLFDDTYNANPDSARAAVRVLAGVHGYKRRVLVLGDMLELGALGPELHHQVGVDVARAGLDMLVAVGELSRAAAAGALEGGMRPEQVAHVPNTKAAVDTTASLFRDGDVVLVKGSRGLELERIVAKLEASRGPAEVS